MKKSAIVLLAVATVGLSGCYTTSSPEGVVRSAYKALSKNDVKKFPKFLKDEAKLQFGTLKGMADLQERLAPFAKVEIGAVDLVDTETNGAGKDIRREFTVQVMGSQGAEFMNVLSAKVDCQVRYVYENSSDCAMPGYGGPGYGGHSPGYYGPYPHCHTSTHMREQMYCLISKID